jgi:cellobiose phosphorylase
LEERVPYENKPGTETPLLAHLERCIQYTLDNIGPHGLPLIGRADWNDCLNLNTFSATPGESFQTTTNRDGKNAESIVVGALFIMAARELAHIKQHLGKDDEAAHLDQLADEMASTTQKFGWDGEWYLRAYDHFGDKIGSKTCEEGKIFIESQGLCPMAGIGLEEGLAEKALQAVGQYLATEHGVVLLEPPYFSYHLHLGEISSYPPGHKENGSVFCHTNPWVMIAETILGHGDHALDYHLRINPSNREKISDLHRCEPYVYAQTIAGKATDHFGEAKNSWLTGTAAWNYVAITQWILGIRPDYEGLRVDPCVPSSWEGFEVTRCFRGATYHISVTNPDGVSKGIRSITLDGQPVEGTILPIFSEGDRHQVEVVMGLA